MTGRTYKKSYTDVDTATRYNRDIYAPDAPDSIVWRLEQPVLLKLLKKNFQNLSDAEALDFACGGGRISAFVRPFVKSLVGVDISEAMLNFAKESTEDVAFIQTDIVESPDSVPGDRDIIMSFRFLLLAEPKLRADCVKALRTKLRSRQSIMVFSLHGNPRSIRFLGSLRYLFRGKRLAGFSMKDMHQLAEECGLDIVDFGGVGYLPFFMHKILPQWLSLCIEHPLKDLPFLRQFGKNLIVVCRKKED